MHYPTNRLQQAGRGELPYLPSCEQSQGAKLPPADTTMQHAPK